MAIVSGKGPSKSKQYAMKPPPKRSLLTVSSLDKKMQKQCTILTMVGHLGT